MKILSNGLKIPNVGYGVWELKTKNMDSLKNAIVKHGYRHIDAAARYKNEDQIGEVLQDIFKTTSIKREDIFITTKLFFNEAHDVQGAMKASLDRLKLDYVDLYLIHWPINMYGDEPEYKMGKTPVSVQWKNMEQCVKQKWTKSIGVSNYNFQLLNDLLTYAEIPPVCNEIELHPYNTQIPFVEWLKKINVRPIAYSPLARGSTCLGNEDILIANPVIKKLAEKHKKTPGQIVLAWGLARGHTIIPKTSSETRALENFQSQNVKLSEEDVLEINKLNRNQRLVHPSDWAWNFQDMPIFD